MSDYNANLDYLFCFHCLRQFTEADHHPQYLTSPVRKNIFVCPDCGAHTNPLHDYNGQHLWPYNVTTNGRLVVHYRPDFDDDCYEVGPDGGYNDLKQLWAHKDPNPANRQSAML